MGRIIVGVDYRHPALLTAYVKVVGTTADAARRNAEHVAEHIRRRLPEAHVKSPRQKVSDPKTLEIPVIINTCRFRARYVLAEIQLNGSV